MAQKATLRPIREIAGAIGIPEDRLFHYGPYMAKVEGEPPPKRGRLILVTALTPTPAGEGKTTVSIGLTQGLGKLGKRAAVALREPSLGPVFGVKGGATGGGYSQVLPMEEINLHFTGDFHAVTSAVNLLAAMVDNHIHQGNALGIEPRRVEYKRVLDMNDRALRHVVTGLGGPINGVPAESGFEITVASEVMAVMALARTVPELKERLGRIRIGYTFDRKPVYAHQLKAHGAMTALLVQALKPNLVQTLEGQPAFVHMGPFANIAHGTNSVRATEMALGYADYVVTEAGFGSDLGAEKFFNVVSRAAGFAPEAVVLVATVRALRYHGGADDYNVPNPEAVKQGLANLAQHAGNIRQHGFDPVIALNHFTSDTEEEIELVRAFAREYRLRFAVAEVWAKGGEGGRALAQEVLAALEAPGQLQPLYDPNEELKEKIRRIATEVYGAAGVTYAKKAKGALRRIERDGCDRLPVVMAKTPASLSDDPKLRGRPGDFTVTVTDLKARCGAGFVVVYMGDVMTMPGLPKVPAAERVDVTEDGRIVGLF
ncbi:formate--tetrahydrofolate ligase [Deinococcota bacterium DY0809b]